MCLPTSRCGCELVLYITTSTICVYQHVDVAVSWYCKERQGAMPLFHLNGDAAKVSNSPSVISVCFNKSVAFSNLDSLYVLSCNAKNGLH
jgi:hypothetical protein